MGPIAEFRMAEHGAQPNVPKAAANSCVKMPLTAGRLMRGRIAAAASLVGTPAIKETAAGPHFVARTVIL